MDKFSNEDIIRELQLVPLEGEGGFYRRTYLSENKITESSVGFSADFSERAWGSAIYYFMTDSDDGFSRFHRLDADEIYHFYGGGRAELHLFDLKIKEYKKVLLGNDLLNGEHCQYLVPAGVVQGLIPAEGVSRVLLGTTMTPAYEERGFDLISKKELLDFFPDKKDILDRFF